MEKKKIAPIMRTMRLGKSEVYPASRKVSIEGTRQRLQAQYKDIGLKFSVTLTEDRDIRVTRIG